MASSNKRFQCVQCRDFFRLGYQHRKRPICIICAAQAGLVEIPDNSLPREGEARNTRTPQDVCLPITTFSPAVHNNPGTIQEDFIEAEVVEPTESYNSRPHATHPWFILFFQYIRVNVSSPQQPSYQNSDPVPPWGYHRQRSFLERIVNNWWLQWIVASFLGGGIGAFGAASFLPVFTSPDVYQGLPLLVTALFSFTLAGVLQGLTFVRLRRIEISIFQWCLAHCYTALGVIFIVIMLKNLPHGTQISFFINRLLTSPSVGVPLASALATVFIGLLMAHDPRRFGLGYRDNSLGIVYGATTFFGWFLGWGLAATLLGNPESIQSLVSSPLQFSLRLAISATIGSAAFGTIMVYADNK